MSHSTTHRFKAGFASRIKAGLASGPILDDDRIITPDNLTDEDVPLLVQYGYGHLIEALPQVAPETEPEKPAEPEDLHKLLKPALQARYQEATKAEPDDKLTKEELIKAIEAAETTK